MHQCVGTSAFQHLFSPVSQSFSMTSWKAEEGTLEIYGWMEIFLITKGSRQPQRPQQCRSLSCTMLIAVYLWLTPQKISNTTKTVVICQWVSISPPTIPVFTIECHPLIIDISPKYLGSILSETFLQSCEGWGTYIVYLWLLELLQYIYGACNKSWRSHDTIVFHILKCLPEQAERS